MRVIQLSAKAGPDGRLHLEIPADAGVDYEVAVVLTANGGPRKPTPEELGWPPGFFKNVIGSIDDPAFKRYPQGEFPKRLIFDTDEDGT